MLAWVLRALIVVILLVVAAFWPALAERFGVAQAAIAVIVLVAAVPALPVLAAYVVSRLYASPRPAGIGGLTVAAIGAELLSGVALFLFVMPFQRHVMGSDAIGRLPAGKTPVLLVHGYMCNRGFWWSFRNKLRAEGHAVATVTLETPVSSIDDLAEVLHARIEALCAETGAAKVALVTHSMGGLVARAYGRAHGWGRVERFVTLAGPHAGTVVAWFGIGENGRQMRPKSAWIEALNREPPAPVPTTTIWSAGDEIIAPQDSSRLAGAREIVLPAMGHMAMAFSSTMAELVVAELAV